MSTPRQPNKRNLIITAAVSLFAQKGIKGTTIRDIAQAAGVTEGALYRYYTGKDELASALFAECARLLHARLYEALVENVEAGENIYSLVKAFFDFAAQEPEAYEYVMARHYESLNVLPPEHPKPKDVFVEAIRRGQASGKFRAMNAELAAAMLIGMCIRTIFFLDSGMVQGPREQVIAEIQRAAMCILSAEAADPSTIA